MTETRELQDLRAYCLANGLPEPVVRRNTRFPWHPSVEIKVGEFEEMRPLRMDATPIEQRWVECEAVIARGLLENLPGLVAFSRSKTIGELECASSIHPPGSAPRMYIDTKPATEIMVHTPHEPGATRINVVEDLGFPPGSVFAIPTRKKDEPFRDWLLRVRVIEAGS